MTDERLAELERLASDATSGPWYAHNTDDQMCMNAYSVTTTERPPDTEGFYADVNDHQHIIALTLYQAPRLVCHQSWKWGENAAFIAEARTAIPELIADVRRLQDAIESEAARRAYAAGLGAGEWEAFLWPEAHAALFGEPPDATP